MTSLKYNFKTIGELQTTLDQLRGDLLNEASKLEEAATKLEKAWSADGDMNEGLVAFKAAKKKFDDEFGSVTDSGNGTTIGTLDYMSKAVQAAGSRAGNADKSVESLFHS